MEIMENVNNTDKRTQKRRFGDKGEDVASKYLASYRYTVVARNFAAKTGEIDIIAIHSVSHKIAFIEVKSRSSISYGLPCEAVNFKKRRKIKLTAEFYLLSHPAFKNYQPSFDIVEILLLNNQTYIRHLKDAF